MKRYIKILIEKYQPLFLLNEWAEKIVANKKDFKRELEIMYEWEYKYSMIKIRAKKMNMTRYGNIRTTIEKNLTPILNSISRKLIKTFKGWLDGHALLSAKTWAKKRVEGYYLLDEELHFILDMTLEEYVRYKDGKGNSRVTDTRFEEAFIDFVIFNSSSFESFFKDWLYDEISNYENELEYAKDKEDEDDIQYNIEQIEYLNNIDLDNSKDLKEYADEFISNFGIKELKLQLEYVLDEDMIINFNAEMVFPLWFKYWKRKGIEKTRKTIADLYKELKKSTKYDVQKRLGVLNAGLNASHQTGSMMDYIGDEYYVYESDLKELSNASSSLLKKWDTEISDMGVW